MLAEKEVKAPAPLEEIVAPPMEEVLTTAPMEEERNAGTVGGGGG